MRRLALAGLFCPICAPPFLVALASLVLRGFWPSLCPLSFIPCLLCLFGFGPSLAHLGCNSSSPAGCLGFFCPETCHQACIFASFCVASTMPQPFFLDIILQLCLIQVLVSSFFFSQSQCEAYPWVSPMALGGVGASLTLCLPPVWPSAVATLPCKGRLAGTPSQLGMLFLTLTA